MNTLDMYQLNHMSKQFMENSQLFINLKPKKSFRINHNHNNLSHQKIQPQLQTQRQNIFEQAAQYQSEKKKSLNPISSSLPKRNQNKQISVIDKSYLQQWLDSVLQDQQSKGPLNAVKKYQVDKRYLLSQNLSYEEIDKLYHSLYVYSFGVKKLLQQILKNQQGLINRFWKVYLKLLQKSSQFQTIFQIHQRKQIIVLQELKKSIKKKEDQFHSEQLKHIKKQKQLQKQLAKLKQQLSQLNTQKDIIQSNYQLTDQAFNDQVALRLRFQQKINEINTAYTQLKSKYDRLVEQNKYQRQQVLKFKRKQDQSSAMIINLNIKIRQGQKMIEVQKQRMKFKNVQIDELRQQIIDLKSQKLSLIKSQDYSEIQIKKLLTQQKTYKLKISEQNLMRQSVEETLKLKSKELQLLVESLKNERVSVSKQYLKSEKLKESITQKMRIIEMKDYDIQKLRKQLQKYKDEVKLMKEKEIQNLSKIETYQKDKQYSKRKIQSLEDNEIANRKTIEQLRNIREKYQKLNGILNSEHYQIMKSLTQANYTILHLNEQIKQLQMTIQSKDYLLRQTQTRYRSQLQICRSRIQNQLTQISKKQYVIIQQNQQIKIKKKQIQQLSLDYQKLQISNTQKDNQLNLQKYEIKNLQSKQVIYNQQILKNKQQIDALSKIIAQSKKSMNQLNSKNTTISYVLQEKSKKAQQQLSGLKHAIVHYKKLVQQKSQFIHPLQYWDLQGLLIRFGQNQIGLSNKIKQLEQDKINLKKQSEFLFEQRNRIIQQRSELIKKKEQVEDELKSYKQTLQRDKLLFNKSKKELEQRLKKAEEVGNQKTAKLKKAQKQYKKLQEEYVSISKIKNNKNDKCFQIEVQISQKQIQTQIMDDSNKILLKNNEVNKLESLGKIESLTKIQQSLPMDSKIHKKIIMEQSEPKKQKQKQIVKQTKKQEIKKQQKKHQIKEQFIQPQQYNQIPQHQQLQKSTLNIKNIINQQYYKKKTHSSHKSIQNNQQQIKTQVPVSSHQTSRPLTNKQFSRALKLTFMRK